MQSGCNHATSTVASPGGIVGRARGSASRRPVGVASSSAARGASRFLGLVFRVELQLGLDVGARVVGDSADAHAGLRGFRLVFLVVGFVALLVGQPKAAISELMTEHGLLYLAEVLT